MENMKDKMCGFKKVSTVCVSKWISVSKNIKRIG